MIKSESIKNITIALLKAQEKIKVATKNAENPYFHSNYADLAEVVDTVKGPLNDNGIVILQPVNGDFVETVLMHAESGEFIGSEVKIINARPNDPQAQGSAITYARRYGILSLLTVPTDDDDGETATKHFESTNLPQNKLSDSKPLLKSAVLDNTTTRDSNGRTYCVKCGDMISQNVEKYSLEKFGKALCVPCQKLGTGEA